MRAPLIGGENYDTPPKLGPGVFVACSGVVHVVRENHGMHVQLFCMDYPAAWAPIQILDLGWFEAPTCVLCALHPGAVRARYHELKWRIEWRTWAAREIWPADRGE